MSKSYIGYIQEAVLGGFRTTVSYEFSDQEHRYMLERGGPVEVELGGTFTVSVPVYGSVTLNLLSNIKNFPDDFPQSYLVRTIDVGDDFDVAQKNVIAWRIHTIDMITAALQARWTDVGDLSGFIVVDEETEIVST
jgi:hypothetical protein